MTTARRPIGEKEVKVNNYHSASWPLHDGEWEGEGGGGINDHDCVG